MNITIPNNFVKVNNIQELLDSINYKRTNFSNGIEYYFKHNNEIFAIEITNRGFWASPKLIIK